MKKINKLIQWSLIVFLIAAPYLSMFSFNSADYTLLEEGLDNLDAKSSDVAGTDLYAEQISAYVAGSKSIIRQSMFTNDTNIFPHFDINDPAFYKCNILLSATNGLTPEMFPSILTDNVFGSAFALSYNSFLGFLYYDDAVSAEDAETRAERALEIIKRKFMIDLIMVNTTRDNFYPFVGYYPNWDHFFDEILNNIPMDGYWKALDVNRLTSDAYVNNHHLSTTYLLINSLEFLEGGINITTDQIDFDLGTIDLSFLENMDMADIVGQLNSLMSDYEYLFGNFSQFMGGGINETIDPDTMDQISEVFGGFALSNDSHYSTLVIQYEGKSEGITNKVGTNEYTFDLFKAMGYTGSSLLPSEKIFIALMGAFMCEIDVNVLGTDIISSSPDYFEFYEYMIEQIGFLLFIAGVEFDVSIISDYSMELLWVNEDGIYRNYVRPVNRDDPNDIINTLGMLGFMGFPFIPTGILNPITHFIVSYNVSYSEPNMVITKDIFGGNASYAVYNNYTLNVTAVNVANVSVWGIPTDITFDVDDIFGATITDEIWNILSPLYPEYDSIEEFLGVEESPRVFQFDTYGVGVVDHTYPDYNIFTGENMMPYSADMATLIKTTLRPLLTALAGMTDQQVNDLGDSFNNTESIWNSDNWFLNPGEKISYLTTNASIPAALDTFERFYSFNFTIQEIPFALPSIFNGLEIGGTNSSMALLTDNESWIVESVHNFEHDLGIQFKFRNESVIDLVNNSIERVQIEINYTATSPVSIQIFNFTLGEYVNCLGTADTFTDINDTQTFGFNKYLDAPIDWMFKDNDGNNFTLYLQITGSDTEKFNISINDFNVIFSDRQTNAIEQLGAQVQYANAEGNNIFEKGSNNIMLSTYDMASVIVNSTLTTHSAYTGEENTYTLNLKNIGSLDAENLSVSLLIPGIMKDLGNFSLYDNNLTYTLPSLGPAEEISIYFSFYTPNSGSINTVFIDYDNPVEIENMNTTILTAITNEIYYTAPVDYETRIPFVRVMQFSYVSNDSTPIIGAHVNLTVNIKNIGHAGISIPDVNFSMDDHYDNLERIDSQKINITNIAYLETKNVTITLRKNDWKAYYYPPINRYGGSESRTYQVASSSAIILGEITLNIEKTLNISQVEIGDHILVTMVVENTGTITVKDISLSDIVSFTQIHFSLVDGKLVNVIDSLHPGEKITFTYSIRAISQAMTSLKHASITFYYLLEEKTVSQEIEVKIIIPIMTQILAVIIPCIIALVVLASYYYQTRKYKADKYELQRLEIEIFDLASRDAILKIEHTLRERLNLLSKEYRKTHPMKTPIRKPKPATVEKAPVKKEKVKKAPVKKEKVKKAPVKKAPVKKEPVKKETASPGYEFNVLMKKTVKDLRKIAADNNIKIPPNTRKADLAQMIVYQTQDKKGGAKQ